MGAQLAATARLPQVTATAGPFAEADVTATDFSPGLPVVTLPPLTLVGRSTPGGPVDDVTLQEGHWPQGTGQIVMEANTNGFGAGIGDTVTVTSMPGEPRLTVVGLATSVSRSADGWVVPAEIPALREPGAPATAEMLYRFRSAGSAAAVSADTAAVTRALPARSVTDTQSYLGVRAAQKNQVAVYAPFVVAFALIGLVMSVLIVSNVVSGAVIAGYYRIGILKSIGFTPGQVIAAYTGQVTVPAVAGCLGGVALGNLLSEPLLRETANVYAIGRLGVPLWVNVTVPLAMCGLVALAAVLPALRAGRLSATQALAAGRAPRAGRGYLAHRLLGRLALPRPGYDRTGITVRPPGAHGGHPRGGRARRNCSDFRGRSGHHAQARRSRSGPDQDRAGAGVPHRAWRVWSQATGAEPGVFRAYSARRRGARLAAGDRALRARGG
jgi:putative ABC transport system permease protein